MKLMPLKRKTSLLGIALGSLIATSLSTGTAEAGSIRSAVSFVGCAACTKALTNKVVAKSDKVLTECTTKCKPGMEKLLQTLENKQRMKQKEQEGIEKDLKNIEKTINAHQGFINQPFDEASKKRDSKAQEKAKKEQKSLMKQNDKLAAEINKLGEQISTIRGALGQKSPEGKSMAPQEGKDQPMASPQASLQEGSKAAGESPKAEETHTSLSPSQNSPEAGKPMASEEKPPLVSRREPNAPPPSGVGTKTPPPVAPLPPAPPPPLPPRSTNG